MSISCGLFGIAVDNYDDGLVMTVTTSPELRLRKSAVAKKDVCQDEQKDSS